MKNLAEVIGIFLIAFSLFAMAGTIAFACAHQNFLVLSPFVEMFMILVGYLLLEK